MLFYGRGRKATSCTSAFLAITRKKITISASTTTGTTAVELGNLLLIAAVVRALYKNGGSRNLDDSIPISESLVLQVLRRSSLDVSKKVDFFRWCSLRTNYKHSAKAYNQIFHAICHCYHGHHYHEIIDLLRSMKRDGVVIDSGTFKVLLDTFIRMEKFDSALDILDLVEEELGRTTDSLNFDLYNSVVVALVRKGQIGLALSIFYKLLEASNGSKSGGNDDGYCEIPDVIVCNELFVALRKADMKADFRRVFTKLRGKKHFGLDLWGYNICIHAFGSWGDLRMALGLFKEMKQRNQQCDGSFGPDLCTYNSLIHVLCLAGKVKDALIVWEELQGSGHEPDAFTYRIILQGCAKSYHIDDAIKIFNEMQYNGFSPDTIVYNSLLDGLLKARRLTEACDLFEKMIQNGVRASCWTYNILIDGLFKNGRALAGYMLFCDLKKKGHLVDGVTYSIVILYLCREGQLEEALQLVEEMEARGFVVDLVTITALLIGLYRQDQWDLTERLMKHIRDGNLILTVLKWKANMEAYMKSPQSRNKDFTTMFPSKGDFSDIINHICPKDIGIDSGPGSGVSRQQDEEFASWDTDPWSPSPHMDFLANQENSSGHFPIFSLSRGRRVQVKSVGSFDINMVNTYLSIFLAKGKLSLACKLFEIFTDMGVYPMSYTYNSMMSSFVKKGYFDEAWGMLLEMGENVCPADIATYNVIIQGLGKMGKADLASAVLVTLMKNGGYLDIIMYNTLINALGKAGQIDEAYKLFDQMKTSGINPDVVTYNTLIEVHSRAGRLKDAYKFLKMMLDAGCPPNHVTDTTLDLLEKEIQKLRSQKASTRKSNKDDIFEE
ncbi:pentatricopeptide repeat-containing protein At4g01570 [Diospyros lotus]|uniref:pentatricopeptide repeat-containing protein At4g01570 n=1 Tax=Diospyros lotus TaxID=55363 RepID=UPI00224F7785|nr:pentatricopeptide repeat-containing protein At4g01570 [Diospyros lotus]XP_052196032.1 pentatricopeptide repeat-containing protein At4g01570 [Diospyros lotus]XP_052196033.1 pentatricopeptide repeat-containing protein At4g01570 [Diospyros lotus]XP_052196034.1 pentatricopeptide repeat-containing protein At4g01570 [Diospyros lotus]XP_052196035.1 pentatricopeptide repeat-containing protein At4g01570 [Diospyros lotus]XP_052196036.1 pentatricopeptide repeat-containing protein At4g01570 [Diospyros 